MVALKDIPSGNMWGMDDYISIELLDSPTLKVNDIEKIPNLSTSGLGSGYDDLRDYDTGDPDGWKIYPNSNIGSTWGMDGSD